MNSKFDKAVKKYGEAEFSRWLLPDGTFLGVNDYEDHRIVGEFCKNGFTDFIHDGAMSIHYDNQARYMWVRTSGLSSAQRMAMQDVFENLGIRVTELKVDFYEFDTPARYEMNEEIIEDENMCRLYLTDTIAYQLEKQYASY